MKLIREQLQTDDESIESYLESKFIWYMLGHLFV